MNPQQETISTSFALTKLTSRLNFLKEKRTQITKDIQNFDKGLGSDSQSHQNQENVWGAAAHLWSKAKWFLKNMRNFKDWKSNLLPMNPPSSILGNLIGFASHLHSEASGLWLTGTYVQFIYLINVFCTTHPVLQSSLALGEKENWGFSAILFQFCKVA